MRKIIAVCVAALALGGCSVTWQEAQVRLQSAIAVAQRVSQQGATATCMHYPQVVAAFDVVAVTGVVNATTVRDVRVGVQALDEICPAILAGDFRLTSRVSSIFSILIRAADAARRQHAMRAT